MATLGETLQQAREQMGVSLDEAERETRIRSKILAAFEDDNPAELPAPVYARGLLRNYATYLNLEPDSAMEMFDAQLNGSKGRRSTQPVMHLAPAVGEIRTTLRYPPGILALFIVLVLGVFVFIVFSNVLGANRPNDTQGRTIPTPSNPTPTRLRAIATTTPGVIPFLPTPNNPSGGGGSSPLAATPTALLVDSKISPTPAPSNPNVGIGTPVVGIGVAGPSPTAGAIAAVPSSPTSGPRPSPTLAPSPPGSGVQVTLIATADSWAQVTVDGLQQFKGTMSSGSRRTFSGDRTVYVWVGNGGGVRVVVNGQDRGALGPSGAVVKRQWDNQGRESAGL